jgi:hypothetical protein
MKIEKINLRKSLKLLMLVISSIVIATASATIYYSLTMQPKVTVSTPVIKFSTAPDEPDGSIVNDAWARLTAKSYPNATLTYEKAVYINNTDSSNPHSFRLAHVSITPTNGSASVSNWTSIRFLVYNSTGYVFSLNYTVSGDDWILQPSSGETSYYSIPASTGWWIKLETLSPADATANQVCEIRISVDVQE